MTLLVSFREFFTVLLPPLHSSSVCFTDVRGYAFPNSGKFHDLGFLTGIASLFGGGGAVSSHDFHGFTVDAPPHVE